MCLIWVIGQWYQIGKSVKETWLTNWEKSRLGLRWRLPPWHTFANLILNSCSNYRFWLTIFKSIHLEVKQLWCKFQAHCLTLTRRMRVKCENIFCVSLWQITSHKGTPPCHNDTPLKSIEKSEATMTQATKHFHAKDSVRLAEMHLWWFYFDFCSLWSSIRNNTLF